MRSSSRLKSQHSCARSASSGIQLTRCGEHDAPVFQLVRIPRSLARAAPRLFEQGERIRADLVRVEQRPVGSRPIVAETKAELLVRHGIV